MPVSKSSESSRPSNPLALIGVLALLTAIGVFAARWCLARGYVLYYGDAEAHLNIARRILDSRTPGPEQIGTVWLPLPHVLMIPFAMRDELWRTGVAGLIPSVASFILAGTFLFAAARRAYGSAAAALAVTLLFALNPNLLYLQSTPMTEPLLMASLTGLLAATLWFRDTQSVLAVLAAAVASNAASLTRYEGWFLIPFVSLYFFAVARNKKTAILFGALASVAPLAWLVHNRFYYGNVLEFYNGPYSAMAIQRTTYAGDHNWPVALSYYSDAARAFVGAPLIWLGAAGVLAALWKRAWWPLFFLCLAPGFYVWSIHSSGTPVSVPDLYNTRYALAVLPLAAFAAGAVLALLPARSQLASGVLLAIAVGSWAAATGRPAITWSESDRNSVARRAWTREAAGFLAANYVPGTGIMASFGDLTGVLREAGIPLREDLHEGNGPAWLAAVSRPDLVLREEWVMGFSDDEASMAARRAPHYQLRKRIAVEGARVVEIYQHQ